VQAEVVRLLSFAPNPQAVKAVISPHAGLGYSGAVLWTVYGRIYCLAVFLMLGPNHRGVGELVALMADGERGTPLGAVAIDRKVETALRRACPLIWED